MGKQRVTQACSKQDAVKRAPMHVTAGSHDIHGHVESRDSAMPCRCVSLSVLH